MSGDAQDSAWAQFVQDRKNVTGCLNQGDSRSFDFAQGPATAAQLLEWVDTPDYECPDCAQFDYQQVRRLIGDCLATAEKVNRLALPKVFWRVLAENLDKAENLWGFTLGGYMGWTRQGLAEDPLQRESVSTTAAQLHILFSTWYSVHGDCLNGTGEVIWDDVLSQIKFSQGKLDRIRVSFEEVEQPFFLWEVDYFCAERPALTITIQSPEIAAWFVLFSLHKVYRLFCLFSAELMRGTSEGVEVELSHHLFEYWAEIQSVISVAQYWYDRIYSLTETLKEFNGRADALANQFNSYEVSGDVEKPEFPYQAVGRVRLLNWFSRSSDSGMVDLDVWKAHWAAMNDEPPPKDKEQLKRYYVQWFEEAKKKSSSDQVLLSVLERECNDPRSDLAGIAVMRLLCNPKGQPLSDDSAGRLLREARKKVEQFNDSLEKFLRHYNSPAERSRRSMAQDAAKEMAISKLKSIPSKPQ